MVTTESGGATDFWTSAQATKGAAGEGHAGWWSCTANGVKDPCSLHQGMSSSRGEAMVTVLLPALSMCAADNMYGQVTSRSEL